MGICDRLLNFDEWFVQSNLKVFHSSFTYDLLAGDSFIPLNRRNEVL